MKNNTSICYSVIHLLFN